MRLLFLSFIFISFIWTFTSITGLPLKNSTTTVNNNDSKEQLFKVLELFWTIWVICIVALFCSCFFFRLLEKIKHIYICIWILLFSLLMIIAIVKIVIESINFVTTVVNQDEPSIEMDQEISELNSTEFTNLHMIPMNPDIPESERTGKVKELILLHSWQWFVLLSFIVVLLSKRCFSSKTIYGCVLVLLGAIIVVPVIIKLILYQVEINGKDVYIEEGIPDDFGAKVIVIQNSTAPKPLQQQFHCALLDNPYQRFKNCCQYCKIRSTCFNFNFFNETCFHFVAKLEIVVYDFDGDPMPGRILKSKWGTLPPSIPRWKAVTEKQKDISEEIKSVN